MSESRVILGDWRPVRDALEYAYAQLGREKPADGGFGVEDWNLAAHVHHYALYRVIKCPSCQGDSMPALLIECLDCGGRMCKACARDHFGPQHQQRADASHRGD